MAKYLIITRFLPQAELSTLKERSARVHDALVAETPALFEKWSCEFVVIGGSFDGIDVVEADNMSEVMKVAEIIRRYGQCTTEIVRAIQWDEFISSF